MREVTVAEKDYSATPLWKKLGIKEGAAVSLIAAPRDFERLISPLPAGVEVANRVSEDRDVIVFFATKVAEVGKRFASLARSLAPAGGLWVAYPKKSSNIPTDLTFANVQGAGLDAGLVDNKSCAIDANWSAVRFVFRLKDRPV